MYTERHIKYSAVQRVSQKARAVGGVKSLSR
jgi:hypothetical protein